ncbi:MAG: isochorismatase family protein [Planctomycetota bacterium]
MKQRSRHLHSAENSLLVLVDIQEKLLPVIPDGHTIFGNIRFLLDAARVLNVPAMVTEQYPKGLGRTVAELDQHPAIRSAQEKLRFSAADAIRESGLADSEASVGARHIILTGIETHICILQTAFDLLDQGYPVTLAVDATGSRHRLDQDTALRRLQTAGVTLTTVEAVAFEWCEMAGTDSFKAVSRLVRDRFVSASGELR